MQNRLEQTTRGIRCEIRDRFVTPRFGRQDVPAAVVAPLDPNNYSETDIACADVNTGLSVVEAYRADLNFTETLLGSTRYPC